MISTRLKISRRNVFKYIHMIEKLFTTSIVTKNNSHPNILTGHYVLSTILLFNMQFLCQVDVKKKQW